MLTGRLYLQPSIRQLLGADALSEAQLLAGQDRIDQQVLQVVYGFTSARAGSLVVARAELLGSQDPASMKDLVGVIAVQPVGQPAAALTAVAAGGGSVTRKSAGVEVELERLTATFTQLGLPLIVLPGLAEPPQVAEEIRLAFQSEIKKAAARLHSHFVSCVLENGLQELVDEVAKLVGRPVAVETSDFKILAAHNMGPTPASQQKTLTDEVAEELRREKRSNAADGTLTGLPEQPVRIGRRMVMPIILEGVVVGYLSIMLRPNDDHQFLSEYLSPAALAALVDFSHRRKDVSTFTVTQKALLKDLLSGVSLSAGDQERLEQHYGFDLCDGFIVLVAQVLPKEAARDAVWQQDGIAMVEMESRQVFVFPHDSNNAKTWQQHAEGLQAVKEKRADLKLQIGASRIAASLLELPDAYTEARQALIIGSMVNQDAEFSVGYGELGIKRLLYLMLDHPELDRFYEENLGQLEKYDVEWETDLVPTLRIYLEHGANLNSAAKVLFIHRHTMRYRLEQVAEILNVDIDSAEVLLNLQIAFLIRGMKGKARS